MIHIFNEAAAERPTLRRASSCMADVITICEGMTPQLQLAASDGGLRPPSGHSNSKSCEVKNITYVIILVLFSLWVNSLYLNNYQVSLSLKVNN